MTFPVRHTITYPANLHLAAFGTQRGIVCCSRRRNLSAARYAPRRTAENSADTAAAQDDAIPIANDNGARMPQAPTAERCLISSPKNAHGKGCRKPLAGTPHHHIPRKTAPCSIQGAARHRMLLPQTKHIRSALPPRRTVENSTDAAAAQNDAMPVPIANCVRTAAPLMPPENLHLAAFRAQRSIVCSSRRRNLSAARYSPRRTAENSADTAAQDDAMPAKTHTAKDAASLPPEPAASHPRKTLTTKRAAKPPHQNAAQHMPPKTCPLQHSERSAASYAVPADSTYPQRVTPLAARLKISADTAAQDDVVPIPTDNGKGCRKLPQRNAAPSHAPQN